MVSIGRGRRPDRRAARRVAGPARRGRRQRPGRRSSCPASRTPSTSWLAAAEAAGIRARASRSTTPPTGPTSRPSSGELLDALARISPRPAAVPFYSTVTGGPVDTASPGRRLLVPATCGRPSASPRPCAALLAAGHGVFVEVSPHPVLATAVEQIGRRRHAGAGRPGRCAATTTGRDAMLTVAGERCTYAASPWTGRRPSAAAPARRWTCRRTRSSAARYWLEHRHGPGDATGLGLTPVDHPLLPAMAEIPGRGGAVLTARLSRTTHPWLADHVVAGTDARARHGPGRTGRARRR